LYYEGLAKNIIYTNNINLRMVFDQTVNTDTTVSKFPFFLVYYSIDGEYRGFKPLDGNMIFCPHTTAEKDQSIMFGVSYINE
jgi:hypothetical protein